MTKDHIHETSRFSVLNQSSDNKSSWSPVNRFTNLPEIMKQASETSDELDREIVASHLGKYDDILTLIGVCTVYSRVDKNRLAPPKGGKLGDHILYTKGIGLEVAINSALTLRL